MDFERVGVGPLLDEDECRTRLVQGVQLAAGFAVHLFDRGGQDVADGVDRLGLDGQRGDDDDGHAGASWELWRIIGGVTRHDRG